jgi:lipoprotein-anchoring transpeptidase ErfK/SrfK
LDDSPTQTSNSRTRRWSVALGTIAVLVPLIVIAIGIGITSGAAGAGTVTTGYVPVTPSPTVRKHGTGLPPGSGALVAVVLHNTTMRVAPGGRRLAKLTTRTGFGSPAVLWVREHSAGWLGVVSTLAGNGGLGWIPRSSASLTRVSWELKVSLSAHRLTVLEDRKVRERYTIAIGAPSSPTPTGRFAVTDRLATHDPTGPYGCCILALSAVAPHTIQGWSGGDRVAIHSTPETASIGQTVSHGCMRLTLAEGQWLMDHIPLGTPTIISSA